uniref:tRNA 2-thiocytidine biosynthesis protein TtcA n=1 Tax=Timema genevievae TaxID=629358 RepID=A0A7R9K5W1_TIMGE|nr:unnamed protein product [Timema genevievae]
MGANGSGAAPFNVSRANNKNYAFLARVPLPCVCGRSRNVKCAHWSWRYRQVSRCEVVYCDYTASGRSLQFIEDYILREVLPCYGNTHTTTSITSLQSTLYSLEMRYLRRLGWSRTVHCSTLVCVSLEIRYLRRLGWSPTVHCSTLVCVSLDFYSRHEARDIFRNAVHASEHDAVIFAGHGCTGAVHKLIHALDLAEPPIVFVGPCEHHSNLLPWRERGAKIVRIAETKEGFLDLDDLEHQLQMNHNERRQLIGCFSAASNITGILCDDIATTLLLHQYGALAFWDYAAAAPYVKLDMNPFLPGVDEQAVFKDAIFFSVHKFIGGVQTPGVLIAKKALFKNNVPDVCGGGSVFFVSRDGHRYLQDTELREEGGTAAVVESVRAGLVMQLKETVGVPSIMLREDKITRMVLSHMRTIPELILLGSNSGSIKRLPIFSFMVRHPRGVFLHHNFVCAVLNDVFGIQARGGCACAGPYAQDLLGIEEELAQEYETVLMEDSRLDRTHLRRHEEHSSYEMLRPGFARISLPFFMADNEVAYVLEALKMVATEAWKLLPQYILNPETGEWRHHTNSVFRDRKWLGSIRYTDGKMSVNERRVSGQGTFPQDYGEILQTARNIFNKARKMAQRYPLSDQCVMFDDRTDRLRWFMLPSEAQDILLGNSQNVKHDVPFDPIQYSGSRGRITENPNPTLIPILYNTVPLMRASSLDLSRHNSLPSVDRQFQRLCTTPPIVSVVHSQPDLVWKEGTIHSKRISAYETQSQVNFAVGEVMNPASIQNTTTAEQTFPVVVGEDTYAGRARCYSLGSSTMSPPVLSPQTLCNLGMSNSEYSPPRHRHCSCSSQTDLNSLDLDSAGNFSPLPSLNMLQLNTASANDCSLYGQSSSPTISTQSPEYLHAYVKEKTKELATEIKSEIRGVISKVENVLSESADSSNDNYIYQNGSVSEKLNESVRGTSVSSVDVAEYLLEVSKGMASEMKTEIREMMNAVDIMMSSDAMSPRSHSLEEKTSSSLSPDNSVADKHFIGPSGNFLTSKLADLPGERTQSSECSSDETVIQILNVDKKQGNVVVNVKDKSSEEEDLEEEEAQSFMGFENKQSLLMRSTINSVSSQDSGINLTFQESDSSSHSNYTSKSDDRQNVRCRKLNTSLSESSAGSNLGQVRSTELPRSVSEVVDSCTSGDHVASTPDTENSSVVRWHCPPKSIWKPAMEALHEFDMIRDGDRVMVCLSGGKDSLSLLHTLHQYQFYARAKGIQFTLGAATVDPGSTAYNPRPLIPYLQALDVHYLYEEQPILQQASELDNCTSVCSFCSRMKRGRLYSAARSNDYNVLALGQHLDDLTESFIMSVFHNGRLRTMKAHYNIRERDLRVIRPFVYVREKSLRQFAESRNLPIIPENCPACFEAPKERHRTKQLLAQQEILFPRLFWSLRSALHPLMSFRHTGEESRAYTRHRKHSQPQQTVLTVKEPDESSTETDEEPAN